MSTAPFDGSAYRREVLSTLRERNPAEVEDLFWLASVPRELDDDAAVQARLRAAKGFLNKELSRARQAAVASAVLKEWPRVQRGLADAGARRTLRERLARTPEASAPAPAPRRRPAVRDTDPAARRRRQVAGALQELARLRDEPELADDLFAFLGLPTTAAPGTIEERLRRAGEVNRRRRADRERTLTDELLAHARELLVVGDPADYLAGFAGDTTAAVVDALLAGDADAARSALAGARGHGVGDAAVLAALAEPARERETPVPVSATGLGVWCPACGTIAPPHATRCGACDGALTVVCDACRTRSPADLPTCPRCSARLDEVRAPLLARRAERDAEESALREVDAAPEPERAGRLAAIARAHPAWAAVRRRLEALPPPPPERVTVTYAGGEARLAWPAADGVGAYLVERVEGDAHRVLGRTGLTTWSDVATPGDGVAWEVRALRGDAASAAVRAVPAAGAADRGADGPRAGAARGGRPGPAPPVPTGATSGATAGGLTNVRAEASVPIRLTWRAHADAGVRLVRTERRPEGEVRRPLSVDTGGYVDRHVGRGRTYEYELALVDRADPPVTLRVTAGAGGVVSAAEQPRRRTSVPPEAGPAHADAAPAAAHDVPAPAGGAARAGTPPAAGTGPAADPAPAPGGVGPIALARDPEGRLVARWSWPAGVTETWVAWDAAPPTAAGERGRKVTNTRYEIDGGAILTDVPPGAHVAVVAGRRDGGTLRWGAVDPGSRAVAP